MLMHEQEAAPARNDDADKMDRDGNGLTKVGSTRPFENSGDVETKVPGD